MQSFEKATLLPEIRLAMNGSLPNDEPLQVWGKFHDSRLMIKGYSCLRGEKALHSFREAPAGTSKSYCPCDHRTVGIFGAYQSDLISQAPTRIYGGARWPTLPDKVTLWSSVSILKPDGTRQSTYDYLSFLTKTVNHNLAIKHSQRRFK